MSVRAASCPSCGAPLEFRNAATVLVVCASCGGASWRRELDLELLGKVAEVTPLESLLEIGSAGRVGTLSWTAVGQVQLDFGAGPWNEWCLLMGDGGWGWLAEAQGQLLFTRPVPRMPVPPHDRIKPGDAVDLGKEGVFVAAEVGQAKVTAVRGEIPVKASPGLVRLYADLRRGEDGFATLDFGDDRTCDEVYVGRVVTPAAMGIDLSRVPAAAARAATADRLQCPSCAGVIPLRDPEGAQRVGCSHCGAVVDPRSKGAAVLGAQAKVKATPHIPLGAKGKLRGLDVECLAFLVRSVTAYGVRYPWREYLLKVAKGGGYRWLAESNGHWSFVEPLSTGAALVDRGTKATFKHRDFRHFQGGTAVVDLVYGEVYWQVAVGERVQSDDYVDPPLMISVESDKRERNDTLCTWIPPEEVQAAFGLKRMPVAMGIAPNQPNPVGGLGKWWGAAVVFAAADLLISAAMPADQESFGFPCCLTLPALLLPAVILTTRSSVFENARWSESDHPSQTWSVTSGDDE